MGNFKYSAKNNEGKTISGTIAAKDQFAAVEDLKKKNLTIIDLQPLGGMSMAKKTSAAKGRGGRKPKKDELVVFTRQLATMVSAGIPLLECLEILSEQAQTPNFRDTVAGVVEEVRSGKDLSKSMEKYPKVFVPLYVSMVRAAEASGELDTILVRLAEYLEEAAKLKREIKAAMTYPVISLVLVIGIASFLLIGIVPKFQPIFDALEIPLPAITQFVMKVAFFCRDYWYVIFGSMGGAIFAFFAFKKSKKGAYYVDAFMIKVPVFGPLFHKVALSRFARTFSTLIKSGVPILAAMEIVAETSGNKVITKAIVAAQDSVRQGDTLSEPLARSGAFPPMVTKMIGIGERSGALEALLEKISTFYDQQVAAAVKSLTSMIEPIMIGTMGFLVGAIVLAVFLPILKIQEKLSH